MKQMEKMNVFLSSKTVEISEYKTHFTLLNRVCFYNHENLNGVKLPYDDTTLEKAKTLIGMPVYGRYTVNSSGEPTFRGHEAYLDEDGNVAFDTDPIGVHMEVYIKEDSVQIGTEILTLPCLFAKQKIWKRNKNVCAAVNRLYELDSLHNSWEISSFAYSYENGIKTLSDYVFEGNTFLGSDIGIDPAYGESAKVISLSSKIYENELLIAESLSKDLLSISSDINNSKEQEDISLGKEIDTQVATEEIIDTPVVAELDIQEDEIIETIVTEEVVEIDKSEISSLTDWDLRDKIAKACRSKLDKWCYVAFHFPLEKKVWIEVDGRESELDYAEFTYEVDQNDEIVLSESQDVKLTVSVSEFNKTISEKNEALISANSTIEELTSQISSLMEIKVKYEAIESEKAEKEKEKQISELRKYVEDAKCFTDDEIDSEEISTLISDLNETKIKCLIADKLISKLVNKKGKETTETSVKNTESKADIVNDVVPMDYKAVMHDFLAR